MGGGPCGTWAVRSLVMETRFGRVSHHDFYVQAARLSQVLIVFPLDNVHSMCFVKPTWQDMARPKEFALYFPIGPETQCCSGCTAMIAHTHTHTAT